MHKVIVGVNDLTTTHPELSKEWHPRKNGILKPEDVTFGSHKKVWWLGKCGHEWEESIKNRAKGYGCPFCSNHKLLVGFNDLATICPELAKEWNYEKNYPLKPSNVFSASNKKVWWIGKCGHEWEATIGSRKQGAGCPICSNFKFEKGVNDLESKYPEIAKEWHPTKNGDLKPSDVSTTSKIEVWWLCPKGHEYRKRICDKIKNPNCPICIGKLVVAGINDLESQSPLMCSEFDNLKNQCCSKDVYYKSTKLFWWKCKNGHSYKASPYSRYKFGFGCPICSGHRVEKGFNDLETNYPYLAKEWHPTKNGNLKPTDVSAGSERVVWWMCPKGHEYKAIIYNRVKGTGCPECSKEKGTSFPEQAILYYCNKVFKCQSRYLMDGFEADIFIPKLRVAIEYDGVFYHSSERSKRREKEKNDYFKSQGIRLVRIKETKGDAKSFFKDDIITYYFVNTYYNNIGDILLILFNDIFECNCPTIDIQKDRPFIYEQYLSIEKENSFAIKNPELLKEWHPTKNGNINPLYISENSNKLVWWICDKGHEWQASPATRKSSGCPYCSNKSVLTGYNDLETLKPELLKEWDYEKNNKLLPNKILAGSHKKVWWKCGKGHSWLSSPHNKSSCPICTMKKIVFKENDISTTHPQIFELIDKSKNKIDLKIVGYNFPDKLWFLCRNGHSYRSTIKSVISSNMRCPVCNNLIVQKGINDLKTLSPEIASEWDYDKNSINIETVSPGSGKFVWWKCKKCGKSWKAAIEKRCNYGSGCPSCAKVEVNKRKREKLVCEKKSFGEQFPKYLIEWDYDKNIVNPFEITTGYHNPVWWKCSKNHSYKDTISHRISRNTGCPFCSNHKVLPGFNDLCTTNPEIASEWDYEKNKDLIPSEISKGSNKKVWWKCKICGYEWEDYVYHRTSGRKCPNCHGKK